MINTDYEGDSKEVEARINYLISQKYIMEKLVRGDKNFGIGDKPHVYFKKLYLTKSQIYGPRLEWYMANKVNLPSVKSEEDRGDVVNKYGNYFEIKSAFVNKQGQFSLLQLRPWQKLDGYCCLVIDPKQDFKHFLFFFNKFTDAG